MLTLVGPFIIYLLSLPVMLITLKRIEVGILFFISFVPILAVVKKISEFPLGNNFADFLLISLVIGWIIKAKKENERIFVRSPINRVVILMMIGSTFSLIQGYLSVPFSDEINLIRLQTWKNYIILPIIYFISINNVSCEKIIKRIIICTSLSMLVMDFNYHTTFRWFQTDHYSDSIRVVGTFKSFGPNEMGIFYSMYTFMLLGISYFIENKKLRYFVLFVCICNLYPILYSFSRSGYICFLVGLLIVGFLKDRRLLIILLAMVLFYRIILPTAVVERIDSTFLDDSVLIEKQRESSAIEVGDITLDSVGRKELWRKAENYFNENALIGMGFNTFVHLEGMITHSIFWRILAEEGLLGMGIFALFIITLLLQSYKLFKHSSNKLGRGIGLGFLSCIILDLVGGMSGDMWLYYNLMAVYWLFMGVVARLNIEYVKNVKKGI